MEKKIYCIKMSSWEEKEAKRLFRKLPFYNTYIEKPSTSEVKNIDLLSELPFYEELTFQKETKHLKDMQEHIKFK